MVNNDEKKVVNLYFPTDHRGWTLKLFSGQPNNLSQSSNDN